MTDFFLRVLSAECWLRKDVGEVSVVLLGGVRADWPALGEVIWTLGPAPTTTVEREFGKECPMMLPLLWPQLGIKPATGVLPPAFGGGFGNTQGAGGLLDCHANEIT